MMEKFIEESFLAELDGIPVANPANMAKAIARFCKYRDLTEPGWRDKTYEPKVIVGELIIFISNTAEGR